MTPIPGLDPPRQRSFEDQLLDNAGRRLPRTLGQFAETFARRISERDLDHFSRAARLRVARGLIAHGSAKTCPSVPNWSCPSAPSRKAAAVRWSMSAPTQNMSSSPRPRVTSLGVGYRQAFQRFGSAGL